MRGEWVTTGDEQPNEKQHVVRDIAWAVGAALTVVGLIAVWYFVLGPAERTPNQAESLNKDWQTIFFFLGFIGIVATGVFSYHRQLSTQDQVTEAQKQSRSAQELAAAAQGQVEAANEQLKLERERFEDARTREMERSRQERYAQGAEMIAHDSPAVRIAGLNVITQLGREVDESSEWRQTCLNLVCSYLRASSNPPEPEADAHPKPWPYQVVTEEACRLLPTLLDRTPVDGEAGAGHALDVDLRGAHLGTLDLSHRLIGAARIAKVTFTGTAQFFGATFTRNARFAEATFTSDAQFIGVTFTRTANFFGATFTGTAQFFGATFTCGGLFAEATFTRGALFAGATFTRGGQFFGATFTEPPTGLTQAQLKGAIVEGLLQPQVQASSDGSPSDAPESA